MTRPRVKTAPASSQVRRDLPKSPTIASVMNSPDLFGPHFKGRSWDAWKTFLNALFGLPLAPDQKIIFERHTGRLVSPTIPFKEAALVVGRRGGKSRILAAAAVFLACFRDYSEYLAPGEKATIGILAANRSQARSIFRFVSGLLKNTPLLANMVVDENNEAITLNNNVVIEIAAASFRTTRGYSYAAVLADEIAFWRMEESSANPDVEILRALRPGMANIPGSILLLASSPYAKRGALYESFRRHYGQDDAKVLIWKADTASMNPRIDPDIIEEAYQSDPESARAEYGAEFRDDLADFVTKEVVDSVTQWGRHELPPESGVHYSAFVDPSGGAADAMTLAIGHLSSNGVPILDAIRECRPPFNPEDVVVEFTTLLKRYNIDTILGDKYGGEWPRQRFREHGVHYEPSAQPKSDLYANLLPLMNAKRVELLDHPRLAAQLVGLERRTARSGKDSIDHGPGAHDDICNAAAGVLVNLDFDRRPLLLDQRNSSNGDTGGILWPTVCDAAYCVLQTDKVGNAAAVYFARGVAEDRLTILDFDAGPISGTTISACASTLSSLREKIRVRYMIGLYVPEPLVGPCAELGLHAQPIPDALIQNINTVTLACATHFAQGHVLVSDHAIAKSREHPLGAAIGIRAGDDILNNPLRLALILGVSLGLIRAR